MNVTRFTQQAAPRAQLRITHCNTHVCIYYSTQTMLCSRMLVHVPDVCDDCEQDAEANDAEHARVQALVDLELMQLRHNSTQTQRDTRSRTVARRRKRYATRPPFTFDSTARDSYNQKGNAVMRHRMLTKGRPLP